MYEKGAGVQGCTIQFHKYVIYLLYVERHSMMEYAFYKIVYQKDDGMDYFQHINSSKHTKVILNTNSPNVSRNSMEYCLWSNEVPPWTLTYLVLISVALHLSLKYFNKKGVSLNIESVLEESHFEEKCTFWRTRHKSLYKVPSKYNSVKKLSFCL